MLYLLVCNLSSLQSPTLRQTGRCSVILSKQRGSPLKKREKYPLGWITSLLVFLSFLVIFPPFETHPQSSKCYSSEMRLSISIVFHTFSASGVSTSPFYARRLSNPLTRSRKVAFQVFYDEFVRHMFLYLPFLLILGKYLCCFSVINLRKPSLPWWHLLIWPCLQG